MNTKVLLLLLALAVCWASAQFTGRSEAQFLDQFHAFTKAYNKQYASDNEMRHRFEIFKQSLKRIEERTKAFPNGASYGVNKFSDLTPEEFRSTQQK